VVEGVRCENDNRKKVLNVTVASPRVEFFRTGTRPGSFGDGNTSVFFQDGTYTGIYCLYILY
jgi:hypothetical protein